MQRTCQRSGKVFEISQKELELCGKMGIPVSFVCPEESIREVMSARNERKLYRRKCDFTGEEIISAYDKDSVFPIYKNEIWWGDQWDSLSYGRDFDFNRAFFEQFGELQRVVPREGTSVFQSENCDYNSHIRKSRNCYLNSLVANCEDVHYSYWMVNNKDCLDCMHLNDSTDCYYCSDINLAYDCAFLEEGNNCNECYFSYQLIGCQHCIFCSNLKDKNYYINNKKCTRFEFEKLKKEIFNGSYKNLQKVISYFSEKVKKTAFHRYVHNLNCENVRGDHVFDCRNCFDCFESFGCEDCGNSISMGDSHDCYNSYAIGWTSCDWIYDTSVARGCRNIAFSIYVWFSDGLRYCDSCHACSDCFGCIGLKHKKYCILNKQYSEEEYKQLLPKIISHMEKTEEWGRFFPPELIVFAYNETAAQDFFPLEKARALSLGFRWKEEVSKENVAPTLSEIPDNISDIDESITKEILACENCGRNYKIILPELKFYKRMNLSLPRLCFDCRHRARFMQRNPSKLFERNCDQCGSEILSSYERDRKEKVLCEKCYLQVLN